jgi:hypothetical protein
MFGDSRSSFTRQRSTVYRTVVPLLMAAALGLSPAPEARAAKGSRTVTAAFAATTANMTPAGVQVRIQVIEWQDAAARAEAVASVAAGADAATPLAKLPTVGYFWPSGSPIGYSLKYAHKVEGPDGERITLVTDKRVGSYDYKPWAAPTPASNADAPYSVIELRVDGAGNGVGSLSLAGAVQIDEAAGTIALADGAPTLLTNVKREPTAP